MKASHAGNHHLGDTHQGGILEMRIMPDACGRWSVDDAIRAYRKKDPRQRTVRPPARSATQS
jgi:hypothetical protein